MVGHRAVPGVRDRDLACLPYPEILTWKGQGLACQVLLCLGGEDQQALTLRTLTLASSQTLFCGTS